MVRAAHRTLLARVLAGCLVAFALSPVTAPFTTIELTDFAQSHPADAGHHPGRQVAVPHVRGSAHIPVMALALAPGPRPLTPDGGHGPAPTTSFAHTRLDLRTVLRL